MPNATPIMHAVGMLEQSTNVVEIRRSAVEVSNAVYLSISGYRVDEGVRGRSIMREKDLRI